jgi:UDP-glucose 4-epimerase
MKTILITGGAGYIGSHVAKSFLESGYKVVVFDNLFRGHKQAVDILEKFGDVEFVQGDLRNVEDLKNLFAKYEFEAVCHLAALCLVYESVSNPELYFENNTQGTVNLLDAMAEADVKKILFSSTGAVYGDVQALPVSEDSQTTPINPYGASKLSAETLIKWYEKSNGIKYIIFRYFNVCGADNEGQIGDSKKPSELLVQNAVRGAMGLQQFYLTCPKVDTPDGTPIRDYFDVEDLSAAHLLALEYLKEWNLSEVFNLGSGHGHSVKEIISIVEEIFGIKIPVQEATEPRVGENAKIFADISLAKKLLGWVPKKTLRNSVLSLKKWYEAFPKGYKD